LFAGAGENNAFLQLRWLPDDAADAESGARVSRVVH